MGLGSALIFGAVLKGLVMLLGLLWIVRSLRANEVGLFGRPGMAPAIRRVREPIKFWLALAAIAVLLVALPLFYVLTLLWSF